MQEQKITKKLTKFGNGHYVLIPRFVLGEWAEKLKMKVYPKIGHEYTSNMETDTIEWFKKHLLQ